MTTCYSLAGLSISSLPEIEIQSQDKMKVGKF